MFLDCINSRWFLGYELFEFHFLFPQIRVYDWTFGFLLMWLPDSSLVSLFNFVAKNRNGIQVFKQPVYMDGVRKPAEIEFSGAVNCWRQANIPSLVPIPHEIGNIPPRIDGGVA